MSDTLVPMPLTYGPTLILRFALTSTVRCSAGLILLASGIYLLKGLLDFVSDCMDSAKRARASASGQVSVALAAAFWLILLGAGLGLGLLCGWRFLVFAALLAYSVFFFFRLAMVKRYSESCSLAVQEGATASRRGIFEPALSRSALLACLAA